MSAGPRRERPKRSSTEDGPDRARRSKAIMVNEGSDRRRIGPAWRQVPDGGQRGARRTLRGRALCVERNDRKFMVVVAAQATEDIERLAGAVARMQKRSALISMEHARPRSSHARPGAIRTAPTTAPATRPASNFVRNS
jgi:hypothetical protein